LVFQNNIILTFQIISQIKDKDFKDQRDGEVRMLVHQSHAGAIIGRAGSKIKELREMTGSNLKVFQEVCPGSTDRILLITVEQSRMADTVDKIIEFLKEVLLYFFH
jgi:heterogeneous nuclear ribonucleoprotein K